MNDNSNNIFKSFNDAKEQAKIIAIQNKCGTRIVRIRDGWQVKKIEQKVTNNSLKYTKNFDPQLKKSKSRYTLLELKSFIVFAIVYVLPPLQLPIAFLTNYYTALILGCALPLFTVAFVFKRGTKDTLNYVRAYTFFSFLIYILIKHYFH